VIWVLIRKLFRPRQPSDGNGVAAKKMADRRLAEAKRRWPEVEEARDILAEWIDHALRGNR
jgi:hypothetical protein